VSSKAGHLHVGVSPTCVIAKERSRYMAMYRRNWVHEASWKWAHCGSIDHADRNIKWILQHC